MRLLKIFTLSIMLFSSCSLFAEDIVVATISSDYIKKTYTLMVSVNEQNEIESIKVRNNKKNKIKIYKTDVLHRPIILVKAAGIKIVTLKCNHFRKNTGCGIVIEYPSNIASGSFKKFTSTLEKRGEKWVLSDGGNLYSRMHLKSKKFLGLLIGIKRIELS
jgi:hypothetical protein